MYNFNTVETQSNIRTKFRDVHNIKTTGNTGDLIPFYSKEILPGDDIKLVMNSLTKMTTPNFQTMDQAFLDVFFFYVPRRLLWKNWKAFQGEKIVGPHENQPEFTIPRTRAPYSTFVPVEVNASTKGTYWIEDPEPAEPGAHLPRELPEQYEEGVQYYKLIPGWGENTIADYLGIPTKVQNIDVDSAYFRAYCLIYNEWFRDQNRQDFVDFSDGDENTIGSNGDNPITDALRGGKCLKAAKIHDYFTSSLLTPTGSEKVLIPLGQTAPVVRDGMFYFSTLNEPNNKVNLYFETQTESGAPSEATLWNEGPKRVHQGDVVVYKEGLAADLSQAEGASINQLRLAFQLQKIFEANNRSGSRYIEQLRNRWNVIPSDATLQRPQYLGGKRIPLNIQMVVQTSSTDNTSPLGQIAGFSNTFDKNKYFSQRFEEHGIIMGICVVRHQRTYQQGLSKFFSRKNMEDFYMPEFQNLGEQAIYNKEIFAQGTDKDDEVFGYQEYGAEYRSTPNKVTGQFRSNAENSFDNWHYADDYKNLPVNGADWIVENVNAVDRTLTLTSEVVNQFYFDFQFEETNVRTMPPHSIPGFIDHH